MARNEHRTIKRRISNNQEMNIEQSRDEHRTSNVQHRMLNERQKQTDGKE